MVVGRGCEDEVKNAGGEEKCTLRERGRNEEMESEVK